MTDLPAGWAEVPLEAVVDILDSRRVPVNRKERAKRIGSVPYYGATGLVDTIDEALFDEELVLLGEDGAPFLDPKKPKAYVIDGPAWVNNHAHVLRAVEGLTTNRYLKHYLDCFDFHGFVTGTTRLKLTQGAMRAMPIRLPPLAEQGRIVNAIEEHLTRIDAAERGLAQADARVGVLADRLSEAAFLGDYPVAALGEVATVGSGSTPKRTESRYWQGGTIPWVTSGALSNRVVADASAFITEAALHETAVRLWPAGTVLVAMYGEGQTRGRAAQLAMEATCNQACAAILPDPGIHTPEFLRWLMNSRYEKNRRLASGGVQPNLSLGLIKAMTVPVPPLDVQAHIIGNLETSVAILDRTRAEVKAAVARSSALRQALLAVACSGRLLPQDPDDEPARVSLDRIAEERAVQTPGAERAKRRVSS